MNISTDLKHAKRFLSVLSVDKNGLEDHQIIELALANGWIAPNLQPAAAEPAAAEPAAAEPAAAEPAAAEPAAQRDEPTATEKALADLIASLKPTTAPFDEKRLIDLIKQYSNPITTVKIENPKGATVTIKGAHKQLEPVIKMLGAKLKVYLYGPAGSGKTTLAKQCAESLSLDFYHTGALLQKYELTGYCSANGDYVSTTFYNAYKNGGVYLFDEIDSSNPQAVIAFNMAIENGSMTFPNEVVNQHDDFRVIAAANTNGLGATANYKRNALDGATLDRFMRVELSYDKKLERRLAIDAYTRNGGMDTDIANTWVDTVQQARKNALDKRINVIISPRSSINGATVLALGQTVKQALSCTFGASLSKDQYLQLDLGV